MLFRNFSVLLIFILNPFVFGKVFNVKDYGAKGDNSTNDTLSIQKTFKECEKHGGKNTVFFPNGCYRTSSLYVLSSNLLVLFESEKTEIWFYNDYNVWPIKDLQYINCINGLNLKNVTWNGNGGKINGNGDRWWEAWKKKELKAKRPYLMFFSGILDLKIEHVTLFHSPKFHLVPRNSKNIEIAFVNIIAPFFDKSVCCDGMDPRNSTYIHIHDCYIHSGDDNIAIKGDVHHVLVENCKMGTGHGTSLGSFHSTMSGSVSNVTFRDITFNGTRNGIRIKTYEGFSGSIQNITWENIKMVNVDNSIIFDMSYLPNDNKTLNSSRKTGIGINGVVISNVQSAGGRYAGYFSCRSDLPCKNILLKDITVKATKNHTFLCPGGNAYGHAVHVSPPSCLKEKPKETR